MISNSRIKMLKLIEKFLQVKSLEICYANVDSLHISIKTKDKEELFQLLEPSISKNIGGLKIEAISDSSFWFDLGRYWLLSEKNVVKYSNFIFNSHYNFDPFINKKLLKKVDSLYGYKYVKRFEYSLYKSFSYKKRLMINNLDVINFSRYDLSDVSTASVACSTINLEKIKSLNFKTELFEDLSTVKCSTNIYT